MSRSRTFHWATGIGIFLITVSLCGFASGGHVYVRDGAAMYLMGCSIIDHHWIDVGQHPNTVGGKSGNDNLYYMPFGFLQPLLSTPFILTGRILAESFKTQYLSFFAATWLNWIISGLLAIAIWQCSLMMKFNYFWSIIAGFAIIFTTPFWIYSQTFFSEPLTALLTLWAWMMIYKSHSNNQSLPSLAIAGILCGVITWLRPLGGIVIPILFLYLLMLEKHKPSSGKLNILKKIIAFMAPAIAGVAGYLTYNYVRFGNIAETGYDLLPDGSPRSFTLDPILGMKILLFSPGKSIFIFAPLLLLLPIGLILLWKSHHHSEAVFVVLTGMIYLVILSSWARVEGGVTWGPRLFLPAVPVLFLALLPVFNSRNILLRSLLIFLIISGVCIQITGITVNFSTIIAQHIDEYFSPADGVYEFSFNPFPHHINHLLSVISDPGFILKRDRATANWNRNSDQINPMNGLDFWWFQFYLDDVSIWLILFMLFILGFGFIAGCSLIKISLPNRA